MLEPLITWQLWSSIFKVKLTHDCPWQQYIIYIQGSTDRWLPMTAVYHLHSRFNWPMIAHDSSISSIFNGQLTHDCPWQQYIIYIQGSTDPWLPMTAVYHLYSRFNWPMIAITDQQIVMMSQCQSNNQCPSAFTLPSIS